jgi:hypothetical protein
MALDRYLSDTGTELLVVVASGSDSPPQLKRYRSNVGFVAYSAERKSEDEVPEEMLYADSGETIAFQGPPKTSLAVGLEGRWLLGNPYAHIANAQQAGYALVLSLLRPSTVLEVRLSVMPHSLGSSASCSSVGGAGASLEQVEAAVACLPDYPSATLGMGVGWPIKLARRLSLTPVVSVEGAFLPWTVVGDESSSTEAFEVGQGVLGGPVVHGRLTYRLGASQRVMRVNLELYAGAMGALAGDRPMFAFPVGALALGSMAF